MRCNFTDKLSEWLDRELTPSEHEQVREHLSGCKICRQVEQDFLRLRDQISTARFDVDPVVQRQALWKVLASKRVPLWRRSVAVPIPGVALAAAILLALGTWGVFMRGPMQSRGNDRRVKSAEPQPSSSNGSGVMDFSRFDRGERAIVYKERAANNPASQGATR